MRTDDASLEALQSAFNDSLPALVSAQVALGRQVSLVDMHSAWVPGDLSDGVHPNLAGYDKMADVWFPAITQVISPLGTADPPAIVRIESPVDLQQVTVRFSKPLADSAASLANFSINNGLSVSQAVLDPTTLRSITLTTSPQSPGVLYTLAVSGVCDRTPQQTPIVPGSTVEFSLDSQTNGSFEAGLTGWTATGNVAVTSDAPYVATQGSNLVVFNGGQTPANGVLSQSFATVAGRPYALTFDVGVLGYNTNQQIMQVTVDGASNLLSQTVTLNGLSGGATGWVAKSFTFLANSATSTLTFRDQSATTNDLDLLLDNVRVSGPADGPNAAPVATADSYVAYQDRALVIGAPGVLANDTDAQANPLSAVLDAGPSHGSVKLDADGGFTYVPAGAYTGADSFTYHANDGSLDSEIVTVGVSVNAIVAGSVINGSFESDFSGWTTTGNLAIGAAAPYVATDGTKVAVFNGGQTAPNGVLSQTFATVVGQTYTLGFDVGVIAYNEFPQTLLVTVTGNGSLLSHAVTVVGLGGGATQWVAESFTFRADSATCSVSFEDQSGVTDNLDLLLDNVRLAGMVSLTSTSSGGSSSNGSASGTIGIPVLTGAPGAMTISMTAEQDGSYVLECSPDLITWEYVGRVQCVAHELMEFHDTQTDPLTGQPVPQMFYRIGLQATQ